MPATSAPNPYATPHERQDWMRAFALADTSDLLTAIPDNHAEARYLRPPEIGMVMVQGRIGGGGAPFNLGEMPMVRCSVVLPDGVVGHAFIAGRDRHKATLAAVLDALMQRPDEAQKLKSTLLPLLASRRTAKQKQQDDKTAATRVNFFTMVRGD